MKTDKISVSVTVPVYNTSKYLRQCLDSLAAQTMRDIEFILVDDGSTDDSGAICDEYASKDPRFRVIHQANGGLAVARQTGLDAARGEYIIPCDSDDWVEPDMYEKLYRKAVETDADMVVCGYYAEYSDGLSNKHFTEYNYSNDKELMIEILSKSFNMSWNKLIKMNMFANENVHYEPGINMGEDIHILQKIVKYNSSIKISYEKEYLYHYRRVQSGQSLSNNVKMSHINQLLAIQDWRKKNLRDSDFTSLITYKYIDIAFSCLRATDFDKNTYNYILQKELSWEKLLRLKKTPKLIFILMSKILPNSITKRFLKLIYRYIYK